MPNIKKNRGDEAKVVPKGERPVILVSNDDGIRAPGIRALISEMKRVGKVYVVAPDREQSAVSHSLTLHRPLRVDEVAKGEYSVDGTPTDCVSVGLNGILKERPHILVSGVNDGENLGEDVTYSGTVSAAMEGTLLGLPSIAISLERGEAGDVRNFKEAARFAARVARFILRNGMPEDTLLNINVPTRKAVKGHRVTVQGKRTFDDNVVEKIDPRGRKYYWISGDMTKWEGGKESDFYAVSRGYISVTPVHLDMTNHSTLEEIRDWSIFK